MKNALFFIFIYCLLPNPVEAQLYCVNDKEGDKKLHNTRIIKSFEQAKDPLTLDFLESQKPSHQFPHLESEKPGIPCATKLYTPPPVIENIKQVVLPQRKSERIKRACIEASLQRDIQGKGFYCDKKNPRSFENTREQAPCLNEKIVHFLHYAINKATECISNIPAENNKGGSIEPIDPRFILKKINNETAFNFFLADKGGVGLSQLTSDPVKDVAGWHEGTENIKGNAFHLLEKVIKNSHPDCAPFAKILAADLNRPPPLPHQNVCAWTSIGAGLARNLIYSLVYYVHLRDEKVKPELQEHSAVIAKNTDLVNYLTLAAYGPGGLAASKALINQMRINNKSDPRKVERYIFSKNDYVTQSNEKMNELTELIKSDSEVEYNKFLPEQHQHGDSCVEK